MFSVLCCVEWRCQKLYRATLMLAARQCNSYVLNFSVIVCECMHNLVGPTNCSVYICCLSIKLCI